MAFKGVDHRAYIINMCFSDLKGSLGPETVLCLNRLLVDVLPQQFLFAIINCGQFIDSIIAKYLSSQRPYLENDTKVVTHLQPRPISNLLGLKLLALREML